MQVSTFSKVMGGITLGIAAFDVTEGGIDASKGKSKSATHNLVMGSGAALAGVEVFRGKAMSPLWMVGMGAMLVGMVLPQDR